MECRRNGSTLIWAAARGLEADMGMPKQGRSSAAASATIEHVSDRNDKHF